MPGMRDETIEVRVTLEEKSAMRMAAERGGLQLSSWMRMVALAAARQEPPREE